MDFLEKDLERIIFETDNDVLRKRGLSIYGKKLRQVRIGNYGIADLITIQRETNVYEDIVVQYVIVTIYELKLEKVGISAFLQAIAYAKGVEQFYHSKNYDDSINFFIRIVLIGKNIDQTGSLIYLPSIFDNLKFYHYKYDLDGLSFVSDNGYRLTDGGF
jgi:hypothetical protein